MTQEQLIAYQSKYILIAVFQVQKNKSYKNKKIPDCVLVEEMMILKPKSYKRMTTSQHE